MMQMKAPLIFDIKRSSTVDGPGVRTTVFFKGCNLDCYWCHNPEGKEFSAQIAKFSEKCIGCGTCLDLSAQEKAHELCPACAIKLYGESYTPKQLLDIILLDKPYYEQTGGGVTFSGGECMLFPDFLAIIAQKCQENGISVAIDTAGNVDFSHFEKVLPFTDLFLYDVKCIDSALHKKGVGVDNIQILTNLEKLCQCGKKIIVRIPCIPGFNDNDELERIKKYCQSLSLEFEILKYHEFGTSKKKALETSI